MNLETGATAAAAATRAESRPKGDAPTKTFKQVALEATLFVLVAALRDVIELLQSDEEFTPRILWAAAASFLFTSAVTLRSYISDPRIK